MHARSVLFAAMMALAAAPALAQGTAAINVSGTIEQVDAVSVSVRNDQGGKVQSFRLAPNVLVTRNAAATLADIRPNDFVASAAVHGADGKLHSTELRIFPDAMRGLGEGQRPMNDARNQTMTNAVVTGTAVRDGSNDIKVSYAGGESEMVVDPGVPVTRIEVADKGALRIGQKVRVQVVSNADGMAATRVAIQ